MTTPRYLPGSIKNAIVAPLLLVTAVAFVALITVGSNIYMASEKESQALEHSSGMERYANEMAHGLADTRAYVREVMAMSRMISTLEVTLSFGTRLYDLRKNLAVLRKQVDADHQEHIRELELALEDWIYEAELLLGLKTASYIPTLEQLDRSAARVSRISDVVVNHSRVVATSTIEQANASVVGNLQTGAALTALFFAAALAFAWRMSGRISAAIQQVSASLRRLSDLEKADQPASANEIRNMFSALQVLEDSVEEKARMAVQLREEMERAEEAVRTKSRFLANMSHEIRTPINGVLGMAEILNSTPLSFEQRECSQTILKSSEALLAVINDILDFSKNEAGEIHLESRPFSLYDIVFDVAGLLGPGVGGQDVEISIDYADDVPKWFLGDAGRMRQVLMNIIGNAVKFTPQGFVILTITYEPDQELPLSVAVSDNGVGIPEDKLNHIFDAFQQAEMHAARRFQGTGLGLAITRQLIEQMGGEISVSSQVDIGSTFTIRMAPEQAEVPEQDTGGAEPDMSVLAEKHVLVVDDLPLNRAILRKTLGKWGMVVHCADGPEAVLALPEAELNSMDIGLLDYNMPNICGDELFTRVRDRLGTGCFPMILYSSSDQSTNFTHMTELGFATVLMKPTRASVLAQSFVKVLNPETRKQISPAQAETDSLAGCRILVAEDNKTNRFVIKKMLGPTGASLVFCENGAEALQTYQNGCADLIFMDMSMPVMDGVTAARKIREFEASENLTPCPIIALTANAMTSDREACSEAGMSDFLSKPVRKAELLSRISYWHPIEPRGVASL